MWNIIPSLQPFVDVLGSAFTAPSFQTHCRLFLAWCLCLGKHTLFRVASFDSPQQLPDLSVRHHFDSHYNFFERSAWTPAGLAYRVGLLILTRLIPAGRITLFVDDTLLHKRGEHVFGLGWWRDAVASTKKRVATASGHNWVVLAIAYTPSWSDAPDMADLVLAARLVVPWTVLQPVEMTATGGATLKRLPGDSVLAGGTNPPTSNYRIESATELKGITALRLRATGYRRPNTSEKEKNGPHGATDGDPATRWDIWPRIGKATSAYFQTGQVCAGPRLTVRLDFQDPVWKQTAVGRFRLSATTSWSAFWQEALVARAEASRGWTRLGLAYLAQGEWLAGLVALTNEIPVEPK